MIQKQQIDQNNQLVIGTQNLKWISGNSDGWIGIGTTTPTALLDVDGDVNITGVATVPQLDVNDLGIDQSAIQFLLGIHLFLIYL